jgi:hypothetical protein
MVRGRHRALPALHADAVVRGRLDASQAAWTRSRWTYLLDRNELDHERFEARPDHVGSVLQSGPETSGQTRPRADERQEDAAFRLILHSTAGRKRKDKESGAASLTRFGRVVLLRLRITAYCAETR